MFLHSEKITITTQVTNTVMHLGWWWKWLQRYETRRVMTFGEEYMLLWCAVLWCHLYSTQLKLTKQTLQSASFSTQFWGLHTSLLSLIFKNSFIIEQIAKMNWEGFAFFCQNSFFCVTHHDSYQRETLSTAWYTLKGGILQPLGVDTSLYILEGGALQPLWVDTSLCILEGGTLQPLWIDTSYTY